MICEIHVQKLRFYSIGINSNESQYRKLFYSVTECMKTTHLRSWNWKAFFLFFLKYTIHCAVSYTEYNLSGWNDKYLSDNSKLNNRMHFISVRMHLVSIEHWILKIGYSFSIVWRKLLEKEKEEEEKPFKLTD